MKKKAFSFIEISIIFLIIGILIAAIATSSLIIKEYNLNRAQRLTKSSVVNSTSGLLLWLETTLTESFLVKEIWEDEKIISAWLDLNPQLGTKQNLSQSNSSYRPKVIFDCANSLPCVRFDGTNDYFDINGSVLANRPFTIIVVEQRRSNKSENYFIAGVSTVANSNLHIGYRTNTQLTFANFYNDYNINAISAYSVPTPRIHVFVLSLEDGKSHYLNGAKSTLTASGSPSGTTPLLSFGGARIGNYGANNSFYNGDLMEIIFFNRALKIDEIDEIQNYLSTKWNITIS
jgi:type II secretory pathway pseudopilin PulG